MKIFLCAFFALIFISKVSLPNFYRSSNKANNEQWDRVELAEVCWFLLVAFLSFMPGNSFHEDLFHHFSRDSSKADSFVIFQIFFFLFL